MGMHLFNVKRLFQRKKYERVLGQEGQRHLDLVDVASHDLQKIAPPPILSFHKRNGSRQRHIQTAHDDEDAAEIRTVESYNCVAAAGIYIDQDAGGERSTTLIRRMRRPRLVVLINGMRSKQMKSQKVSEVAAHRPAPANKLAVQNFLEGPSGGDDVYQQQCRDLLRKLSARGNRVPGLV